MRPEADAANEPMAHSVIVDLCDTEVSGTDLTVWNGFRVFKPTSTEAGTGTTASKRRTNAIGNPAFDYTRDTLFDYPTIVAHKLGRTDWQSFNRFCSIHVPDCTFECWHCYNDAWPPPEGNCTSDTATAEFIVEKFFEQRDLDRQHALETNVLRITGGEPFRQPRLIAEVAIRLDDECRQRNADCLLWTETNLCPLAYPDKTAAAEDPWQWVSSLKDVAGRVVVHPCVHGTTDGELAAVTGRDWVRRDRLIEALRRLKETGLDLYPTIHSNLCDPAQIEGLFMALLSAGQELPLRTALIEVDLRYDAVRRRMARLPEKRRRRVMIHSRHACLYEWDRLVQREYGLGYGVLPRHLATAQMAADLAGVTKSAAADAAVDLTKEVLLLMKSSRRDVYRQQFLTMLGLPEGWTFSAMYDGKWMAQDVVGVVENRIASFDGYPVVACFTESLDGSPVVVPARSGTMAALEKQGDTVTTVWSTGAYPGEAPTANGCADVLSKLNKHSALTPLFGHQVLPPTGPTYVCLAPYVDCIMHVNRGEQHQHAMWDRLVLALAQLPSLRQALFAKLEIMAPHSVATHGTGSSRRSSIRLDTYDDLRLKLLMRMPNYTEVVSDASQPHLKVSVANEDVISYVGPERIEIGKYDEVELLFRCGNPSRAVQTEILIFREDAASLGPMFRLPVTVRSVRRNAGEHLASGIAMFLLAAGGLAGTLMSKYWTNDASYEPYQWWWPIAMIAVGCGLGSGVVILRNRWGASPKQ